MLGEVEGLVVLGAVFQRLEKESCQWLVLMLKHLCMRLELARNILGRASSSMAAYHSVLDFKECRCSDRL
jgi:hypothetical protein